MSGVPGAVDESGVSFVVSGGRQKSQDQQSANAIISRNTESLTSTRATPDIVKLADGNLHYGAIQEFLDDPAIEEIWINSPSRIFIAKQGVPELTTLILTEQEVKTLVERMLAASGRRVDLSQPFVDAMLGDGSRIHVAIPDVTREHWSVNIRKFVVKSHSLADLVKTGSITSAAANFLQTCVDSGLNIIVSGATGAGKTTMMNALLNSARSSDRVITCEEVFELQLINPDWVAMQTRQPSLEGTGEVTLRRIIKEALRMRPTRLVVGEVRQAECLDLLVAMNSGMPSMCSIHANGAREAIAKLCLLPMLAGSNVSAEFVVPAVAAAVDVVVHIGMLASGQRVVHEISTVSGRIEGSSIELMPVFTRKGAILQATGFVPEKLVGLGQDDRIKEKSRGQKS
ncbi:MAG: ATPase, T2SS/T4P/T4SS family [Actinobacteria bacterium]|nr:ATPase, T2SS/T4P/T4SS family [Actinomycetota bacterium]